MIQRRLHPGLSPSANLHQGIERLWQRLRTGPMRLVNTLSRPVVTTGLELGSRHTWVVFRHGAVVPSSASCLAIDRSHHTARWLGDEAARLEGRDMPELELTWPIQAGRILHRAHAVTLVRHLLQARTRWGQRVVVAVPHELTPAERRSLEQVVLGAGVRQVLEVDAALAGGLGAGLKVLEPSAVATLDVGASCTRLSVMALGQVILSHVWPVGGDALDEAVRDAVLEHYRLKVGLPTARRIKETLGCAVRSEVPRTMDVDGQSLETGLPRRVSVSSSHVDQALQPVLDRLMAPLCRSLQELPSSMLADITQDGALALLGGGARLAGLLQYVEEKAHLHARLLPEPEQAVARGLDQVLRQRALRRSLLVHVAPLPVPATRAPRSSYGLAGALGLLSLVLAWHMMGTLPPYRSPLDRTLTSWMVPAWSTFNRLTRHSTSPLAMDPAQHRWQLQVRDRDRRIRALTAENQHLRRLVHMGGSRAELGRTVGAQVVARDPNAWMQTMVLDVGRQQRVAVGLPVLGEDGVVGVVADVSNTSCRVSTITARGVTTAAVVARRRASGVAYGIDGRTCELRFLDPNAGVRVGDVVSTSGQDRFPEGLPFGRVVQLRPAVDGVSVTAVVRPTVALDSIREVLVGIGKHP